MIEVSRIEKVLVLSINRPESLNALNQEVMHQLIRNLDLAEKDDTVKVVILTGSGKKAFVAGADINEFLHLKNAEEASDLSRLGQSAFAKISKLSKPVICAINGYCLGGGLELALACDIRFAAAGAKLGLPEIKLGLFPGYGGAQRLPRLIGKGKAFYLLMSGEMISAIEAERLGIVEKIVQYEVLMDRVLNYAQLLSTYPSKALCSLKQSVNNGLEMTLDDALEQDAVQIGRLMVSDEALERAKQFLKN